MFSTLRTRFGIPGVISVTALVFAMFGGAYAASNSSNAGKATASAKAKKGPRGPKGATGPAGSAGAQGPAGPAGANGSNGVVGPTGPAGPQGIQGKPGATGPQGPAGQTGFTETLPSKRTEKGTWSLLENGLFGFPAALTSISFTIPLAEGKEDEEGDPAEVFLNAEETELKTNATCTGTVGNPTAPPGVLCLYTAEEEFFETEGSHLRANFRPEIFTFGYGSSGAFISGYGSIGPEAEARARGTWAVTAP